MELDVAWWQITYQPDEAIGSIFNSTKQDKNYS